MSIRIFWRATALGLGLACCAATAPAAEVQAAFPNKRVTIVVPYSAGGLTDTLARSLAAKLATLWGRPVVVENRDGAGTIIGTSAVARTPADGYTLLFTSYAYTSNPVLRRQLPYGPDAFRPVGLLGSSHNVLLVTNRLRGQSLQNLIDRAKAEPGSFKLASSGPGSSPHLAAELFATKAGIRFTHVPYKGQGPSMTDLMAGVVDGMFDGMSSYALVKSGKVAAVAIAAEQRHPGAPEIPTFKELGMDFVSGSWFGMLAPAATPDAVVRQINADLHRALEDPAVRAQIAKTGLLVSLSRPEAFGQFLQAETRKLQALLQSGVRIDLD
ncbi:tripartite tricarboxylate transporter substrate binding protein [Comamonas squillarum]|uniref:Tripartite tricarboxylate transporter substrate binding protein n=1 Tax=Comamonas squillarum TaxID=2977320 RepID=A0ABY6A4I4_9BURK|nr:tripartite tricarboxylate transporter substrate binding protein [Comamonas sp. PR12]UXC19860.1 tripartite tricarboxylate transporter substrate binding protein [Comamonas sp. PR12]